jgi:hypothetical protein
MDQDVLESTWDDYVKVLREDSHQLLAWGHRDVRTELSKARDEYDITGLIGEAIERRINDPGTPERFAIYVVRSEHPVSPVGERGKDRPKLDVQIVKSGRPQLVFTFEAKRLRDDGKASVSDSLREYLGNEGVGRFVAGRYAAECLEAAMLGCGQSRDAHFWLQSVCERFADDISSRRNVLKIVQQIRPENVISDLRDEAVSVHERPNARPIRLFHIFLDCN